MFHDLRYALRGLRRAPGFALAAILSLALGIGAATAIFSVADALLLRRLPYPNSERLVLLFDQLRKVRAAAAAVAIYIPVRRALKIDPAGALRSEYATKRVFTTETRRHRERRKQEGRPNGARRSVFPCV